MECVAFQCSSELAVLRALHCAVRISFQCLACMHHSMHFSRFQCSALLTFQYRAACIAVHFSGLEDVGGGSGGDLSVAATVSIRLVSYPPN